MDKKRYVFFVLIFTCIQNSSFSAERLNEKITNECGSNPVISYIKEIKESVIDPQILMHARECATGGVEGKIYKWSLGDAKVQGCLEREYKYTPEYIKKIAPLVDDAQENTQGIMEGYNQCVNNIYKCGARFCKEKKKAIEPLSGSQLNLKEEEIRELSNDYSLLRSEFLLFENQNGIKRRQFLPEGEFDQRVYDKHLEEKLSYMGGQMQGMLLLTSLMPIVQEVGDGSKEIRKELEHFDISKIQDTTIYRAMLKNSKSLDARSKAILLEMVDFVQKGRR